MRERKGGLSPLDLEQMPDMNQRDDAAASAPPKPERPRGSRAAILQERYMNRNKTLAAIDRSMRVSSNYNKLFGQLAFAFLVFLILLLQRDVPVVHTVERGVANNLHRIEFNGIRWENGKGRLEGMTDVNDMWGYMTELALHFLSDDNPYYTNVSQLVCCLHVAAHGSLGSPTVDIPRLSNRTHILTVLQDMRAAAGIEISGKGHELSIDAVMVEQSVDVLTIIHSKARISHGGWIDALLQYRSFRSRVYKSAGDILRSLMEVVYLLTGCYLTYRSVLDLRALYYEKQRGNQHIGWFWPCLDFFTCLVHLVLVLLWLLIATNVLVDDPNSQNVIVEDVRRIFTLYDAYYVAIFILTLSLIAKLFQFADKESKFGGFFHTIKSSFVDIVHFLLVLLMLLIFFTLLGNYLFGEKLVEYKNFLAAFQSNVGIILGEFGDLRDKFTEQGELVDQRWVPHFYFWVFIVVMNFVLLNMFIAIVLDAYANMAKRNGTLLWHDVREGLVLRWHYFRRKFLRSSDSSYLFPSELRDAIARCDNQITLSQLTHQVCMGNDVLAEKIMSKYSDDRWGKSSKCETCGEYGGGNHPPSQRASAFGEMSPLKKLRMVDDSDIAPAAGSFEDLIRAHFAGQGGAAILRPQEGGRRASLFYLPGMSFDDGDDDEYTAEPMPRGNAVRRRGGGSRRGRGHVKFGDDGGSSSEPFHGEQAQPELQYDDEYDEGEWDDDMSHTEYTMSGDYETRGSLDDSYVSQ